MENLSKPFSKCQIGKRHKTAFGKKRLSLELVIWHSANEVATPHFSNRHSFFRNNSTVMGIITYEVDIANYNELVISIISSFFIY
jgi:hypothetical protein